MKRMEWEMRSRSTGLSVILLALLVGLACSDDDGPAGPSDGNGNTAPTASVAADPTEVPAGDNHNTVVTIDASGSTDPDGDPLSFQWTVPSGQFVNGTSPTDQVIEVTFPGVAPYTVTVEVSDGRGGTDQASVTIGLS